MSEYPKTARTTVRRRPARASYDRSAVHAVLDEALIAHVAFVEDGRPRLLPMAFARDGERLLLHGSRASHLLNALAGGAEFAVAVTLLDGLVLARSAFHHSMNYRSVVVYGRGRKIEGEERILDALHKITERLAPGRWERLRPVQPRELAQTLVIELPLAECVLKARAGPPVDDEADYAWPVWAGVLPVGLVAGEPVPDGRSPDDAGPVPARALARPPGG